MQVEVPDDIVARAETNAAEIRIFLALQLYADNRIDYTDACRLAGLSTAEFNAELLSRAMGILQYPAELHHRRRNAG